MSSRSLLYIFAAMLLPFFVQAQPDSLQLKKMLRAHIDRLAAPYMQGRGYVEDGLARAADYIEDEFKKLDMERAPGMHSYRQPYEFPVNVFPAAMQVSINGKPLIAGRDYLVNAASASCKGRATVKTIDVGGISSPSEWKKAVGNLSKKNYWLLRNADSFCKSIKSSLEGMPFMLPEGCFIIPVHAKQSWSVSGEVAEGTTVIYVYDSVLPAEVLTADVNIEADFEKSFRSVNIMAKVPGLVKDTFVVITAHYDHLGRMGPALFPGASDNASGMSVLLYLTKHFATHMPRYTTVFIAFSGEEAGLLGSKYFVEKSPFPLRKIKFLTNIDIMGDATDGITVVNGSVFPAQFDKLTAINNTKHYVPEIKARGKAAISDHYHFYEKGVPCFFMYSMGGKGYYHDIYDQPEKVTLHNVAGATQLLIDFIGTL